MKKEYQKPKIKKVSLKVEQTVLGGCKYEGYSGTGPGTVANNCENPFGDPCVLDGS